MTAEGYKRKKEGAAIGLLGGIPALLMLAGIIYAAVFASRDMSEFVLDGIKLAVKCVIPSSFPFMIISDIYAHYGHPERIGILSDTVTWLLGVPRSAVSPFIIGNASGFPIGAKSTADLYREGCLEKRDAERLLALSSNPSPAFVIGAVGLGMYGDMRYGLLLLFSLYIGTLVCGIITRGKQNTIDLSSNKIGQKYNFVASVKNAGLNSLSLIAFISCFSAGFGIVKKYLKNELLIGIISALSEVTNAVRGFALLGHESMLQSIIFSGFSLGFGGLCVMMQSAVFTSGTDLSFKPYIKLKLLHGLITATVAAVGYFLLF